VLGVFKQNTIATAAALVFLTVVTKLKAILHPVPIAQLGDFYRGLFFEWTWMKRSYLAHPSLYTLCSVLFVLLTALYINMVVNREKFYTRKSYLPALSFVLLTSMLPVLNVFSFEAIAGCFLFMAAAKTLSLGSGSHPRRAAFDVGFFLGMAMLFYFPSVLFFLLFPFLLMLFRPLILQELVAWFMGVLAPLYLMAAWLFVNGQWAQVRQAFLHISLPVELISLPVFSVMTLSSVILLFYSLYLIAQTASRHAMVIRKKWNLVSLYLLFALFIGCFSPVFPSTPWFIAMIPFSIILSYAFQQTKEKYNTFTLYFLLAVLVTVQWLL